PFGSASNSAQEWYVMPDESLQDARSINRHPGRTPITRSESGSSTRGVGVSMTMRALMCFGGLRNFALLTMRRCRGSVSHTSFATCFGTHLGSQSVNGDLLLVDDAIKVQKRQHPPDCLDEIIVADPVRAVANGSIQPYFRRR